MMRIGKGAGAIDGDKVIGLAYPGPYEFEPPSKGGLAPRQVARLRTIAQADLQSSVSVDRLARECRLSVGYFTRAFRATMGTTPYRWLVGLRLERAKSLLAAGTLPIAEIALICGFWDQAHFTRTFSRTVGASPAAWARRQREPTLRSSRGRDDSACAA